MSDTRRHFLRSALMCGAAALPSAGYATAPGPKSRRRPPNVVLILFDWCRRDAIGAYGLAPVRTPNLDRLANGGARFENCYTTAALCTPARASIITGLYPHSHGLRQTVYPAGFESHLPTQFPEAMADPFGDPRFRLWENFPFYLQNSGYDTAHFGKWHLGNGNPGFFDVWKSYNSLMAHWVGAQDASPYRDTLQTDQVVDFIADRKAGQPFFVYTSYYSPHAPYEPPAEALEQYEGVPVAHKEYYATVTALDREVGRIVRALEAAGTLDDTLIIVSTDHGGSFRQRPGSLRGMGVAYDEVARIPLIMHWPARIRPGQVRQAGASLVDIAPTVLGAAGIRTENAIKAIITGKTGSMFQGRDLIADIESGMDEWTRPIFIENIPEAAINGSLFDERCMRHDRWKLTLRDFHADPRIVANAMFDLATDPEEDRNLIEDPAAREDLKRLLRMMAEQAVALDDPLAARLADRALRALPASSN